ncbi:hypothetical protein H1R20_g5517, partial [Candolleomyces eurysporus]
MFLHSFRFARSNVKVLSRRFIQVQAAEKQALLKPIESHPGVWGLALNRPQSKNAISVALLQQFRECLETVLYDKSVRVLILHSTTVGSFCAGADLIERRSMSQVQVTKFLTDLRDALGKLEALPMPTIAAIDGPALGGGLEMSLACDLRVAAPLALRAAKQAISRSEDLALETGLDFERATYETLLKTQDRLEALSAFKEKRKPLFKGE